METIKPSQRDSNLWSKHRHRRVLRGGPVDAGGDLLQYLKTDPGANRVGIVRALFPVPAGERTEFYVQGVWSIR